MKTKFRNAILEMDPNCDIDGDAGAAAAILMAGLECGTRKVSEVAKLAGVPFKTAAPMATRLRHSGIWRDGKTFANWGDEENGGIAFWMDVCVATGMLRAAGRAKP